MNLYQAKAHVTRQNGPAFLLDVRKSRRFDLSPAEEAIVATGEACRSEITLPEPSAS